MFVLCRYCCLLMLLLLMGGARADSAAVELSKANVIYFSAYTEVLEDKSGKLTLADVLAADNRFRPTKSGNGNHNRGFTLSAHWFRVKLHNTSPYRDWHFRTWGSLNRLTSAYLAVDTDTAAIDNNFVRLKAMPHSRHISYHLRLKPDLKYTLYYRIQDKHSPVTINNVLNTTVVEIGTVKYTYPLISFVVGGLFILALYNFLYFLYLRDDGFLALSLLILTFTLEMGGHSGLWHGVVWMREHLHSLGTLFGLLCIACGVILFRQWLGTYQNQPILDRIWRYAFWLTMGLAVICPFIPFSVAVIGFWMFCFFPLACLSLVLFYRQGLRLPHSMLLAGLLLFVSLIPSLLRSLELTDDEDFIAEGGIVGLLLALMLLSLTQAGQIQTKKKQTERTAAINQAKDEFLTTMSHELRTPMNSVVSAGQLLKRSALSNDQAEYVNRLNTSSKHMLSLINDILDLARLDQQSMRIESTPFQIQDTVQPIRQLLAEQARAKSIQLVIDNRFHSCKQQVLGDPLRLQQILLNLLNNAIKFTQQGEVRLTITPQAVNEEAALLFEVKDTGIGITEAQQAELFQPFSQADSSTSRIYGGSGLGLAISHKLVNCMGGQLQVTSKSEQGSRFFFTLTLPLSGDIPEKNQAVSAVNMPDLFTHLRVLLVDDHEMNRFFNSRLLASIGINQLTTVGSGRQALACLQQQTVDLVLIDVSMPDMDGYETTRNIRRQPHNPSIVVIALTAHAISGERERCLAAGMDDYMTKPFTRSEMKNMLYKHFAANGHELPLPKPETSDQSLNNT